MKREWTSPGLPSYRGVANTLLASIRMRGLPLSIVCFLALSRRQFIGPLAVPSSFVRLLKGERWPWTYANCSKACHSPIFRRAWPDTPLLAFRLLISHLFSFSLSLPFFAGKGFARQPYPVLIFSASKSSSRKGLASRTWFASLPPSSYPISRSLYLYLPASLVQLHCGCRYNVVGRHAI